MAKYFANDSEGALKLANSLSGKRREEAFGGIAYGWSETNFTEAIAWAKSFEDPELRTSLVHLAVHSLAQSDPLNALEYLKTAPPGMDSLGSTVVFHLATKDFPAALKWAANNPRQSYLHGLRSGLHDHLITDPRALVDDLHSAGAIKNTASIMAEHQFLMKPSETRVTFWNKLLELGDNADAAHLRKEIVSRSSYQDPDQIMNLIDKLPGLQEKEALILEAASKITAQFGTRTMMMRDSPGEIKKYEESLDEIITEAPESWRSPLIGEAFKEMKAAHFAKSDNLDQWISYYENLSVSERQDASKKLAFGIGERSPEKMAEFFSMLKTNKEQINAGTAFIKSSNAFNPETADQWLTDTPMSDEIRTKIRARTDPWK